MRPDNEALHRTAIPLRFIASVTFEKDGLRATFHRPHPDKAALRYRVLAAREFLTRLGGKP